MIVVRDIFHLKFGQSKEAVSIWKQIRQLQPSTGYGKARMLTDFAGGRYYTLVLESEWDSVSEWEAEMRRGMGDPQWRALYSKIVPLTESGKREILSVIP
jgi:hypothetical protein